MEAFEELLDERNMLKAELAAKDSLIKEQRKENEVKFRTTSYLHMYLFNTTCVRIYSYVATYT